MQIVENALGQLHTGHAARPDSYTCTGLDHATILPGDLSYYLGKTKRYMIFFNLLLEDCKMSINKKLFVRFSCS